MPAAVQVYAHRGGCVPGVVDECMLRWGHMGWKIPSS